MVLGAQHDAVRHDVVAVDLQQSDDRPAAGELELLDEHPSLLAVLGMKGSAQKSTLGADANSAAVPLPRG